MGKIVAIVVSIILVMVLAGVVLFPIYSGAKDTGVKSVAEQSKLDRMVEDTNTLAGNSIKQYMRNGATVFDGKNFVVQPTSGLQGAVSFSDTTLYDANQLYIIINSVDQSATNGQVYYKQVTKPSAIKDNSLFNIDKTYNANGKLNRIVFTQIDLGN